MSKSRWIGLWLLWIAIPCGAFEATEADALSVANALFAGRSTTDVMGLPPRMRLTSRSYSGKANLYYVQSSAGWAVLSSDKRARPVLAYSYSVDSIDFEDVPDGFIDLMRGYEAELQFLRDSTTITEEDTGWDALTIQQEVAAEKVVLSRLDSILWNQDRNNGRSCGKSYNHLCPTFAPTKCDRNLVGCTAVAMAQIMRYYQWPWYAYAPDTISSNGVPSESTHFQHYDWQQMPYLLFDSTPDNQWLMIATLLRDCGYAAHMKYRDTASGASLNDAKDAFCHRFQYSSDITYHKRSSFSSSRWVQKVKSEIDAGRPVLYAGYGSGGHAVVVDGYCGSHFRINWGWADRAANDSWYLLDSLQPNSHYYFNEGQEALFGIQPVAMCGSMSIPGIQVDSADSRAVGGTLDLSLTIGSGQEGYYYAGTRIRLTDGFHAMAGSKVQLGIRDFPCESRSVQAISNRRAEDRASERVLPSVILSPNPVHNQLFIQTDFPIREVIITTLFGQPVVSSTGSVLDVHLLPSGVYILAVTFSTNEVAFEKFIKY